MSDREMYQRNHVVGQLPRRCNWHQGGKKVSGRCSGSKGGVTGIREKQQGSDRCNRRKGGVTGARKVKHSFSEVQWPSGICKGLQGGVRGIREV